MLTKLNAMPAGGSSPADKKRPASEAPRKTLASKAAKIDARRAARGENILRQQANIKQDAEKRRQAMLLMTGANSY